MPFTAAELEAMRLADEEIEREYEANTADTEISNWLDELAINDRLDHRKLHNKRYRRAYREEHKDEIRAYQRAYQEEHKAEIAAKKRTYREEHKDEIRAYQRAYREEHRKRKRMNAEIKNTAPDTAIVGSGT